MAQEKKQDVSRRRFLLGAGALAAGAVASGGVLGVGGSALASAAEPTCRVVVNGREVAGPVHARIVKGTALVPVRPLAEALGAQVSWEGKSRTVIVSGQARGAATPVPWPWPYKKLDPEEVRKRGYQGYYEGACAYGVFKAVVTALEDAVGYPYNLLPVDMMRYGEGGVVGWSSLCGALTAAGAVINLVSDKETYPKLINELMGWYTQNPFPSNKYTEKADKFGREQVQSVSGSPLCHVSVTNWCKASGFKATSPERSERCARLTGDVAAYAVELLNKHVDGQFASVYVEPASITECMSCHGKSGMNNTRGKMDCVQCHEPHKK